MARTKFTGPKPESPAEVPPPTGAAHDGAPKPPTAAIGAPAPTSAAKSKVPGEARITKRVRGTAKSKYSKEVLILYEALTFGVDAKVSTKSLIPHCSHLTDGEQQVDHAAVARAVGINTPAARMRFTRLMKKIKASYEGDEKEGDVEDKQEKGETPPENENDHTEAGAEEDD